MGRFWTSLLSTKLIWLLVVALPACSQKPNASSSSKIALTFPTTQQMMAQNNQQSSLQSNQQNNQQNNQQSNQQSNQKMSAFSGYDWSRVCYMINVTANDIPQSSGGSCSLPIGIFRGAIPPGGSVLLEVARGKGRKLEVFTFMRESESAECPSLASGFGTIDPLKIVRVGQVPYFDTEESTMTVRVDLQEPGSGTSLISQYQLPVTCGKSQPPPPTSGTARVGTGQVRQAGGTYIVDGTISGQKSETFLSGGSYRVQFSRKAH